MRISRKLTTAAMLAVVFAVASGQTGATASAQFRTPTSQSVVLPNPTPSTSPSPVASSSATASPTAGPTASSTPDPAPQPSPGGTGDIGATPDSSTPAVATPSPTAVPPTAVPPTAVPPAADLPAPVAETGQAAIGAGAGAISTRWTQLGGVSGGLGKAVSEVFCGLKNDGCAQRFEGGAIHWSVASGAQATRASIAERWASLNWESGRLGYPIAPEFCGLRNGGCVQRFEGGAIHWSPATGAHPTWAAIADRWAGLNWESGQLGYPLDAEFCALRDNGCVQRFQGGVVYWSPVGGAQPVWGSILAGYGDMTWENGRLGYPVSSEFCGLRNNGCLQRFERGAMHWSPASGAFGTTAAIADRWASLRWESGQLGYPVSQEYCGLRNDGCVQRFQGGAVYWSPVGGAQPIWGAILGTYGSRGWEAGSLGYPVSAENCGNVCVQEFQYGRLTWSAVNGIDFHLRSDGYCEALNRGSVRYGAAASRVSFAIAEGYPDQGINFTTCVREAGKFRLEWVVPGYAGESGFARPGVASGPTINKYSPTGAFTVTEAFGLGNPGTSLAYQQLNQYSRWGGRLNANYNKYFESSADVFPDENMWYYATRWSHDYRQGVVINYNRPPDSPIVPNAGFAIFLHANRVPTWGCISLDEADIVRYQRSAAPGDKIVMGVVDDVFR